MFDVNCANAVSAYTSGRIWFFGKPLMKAVLLSRGRGIHLLGGDSLTSKALIPINGVPFLLYILKHFYFYGITQMILCVDSACEEDITRLVTEYDDDPRFKRLLAHIDPQVVNAGRNNKTGSMLYGIRDMLADDDFIITYNDIITDVNLCQFLNFHKTKGAVLTAIGVHPTVRQGIIRHENGVITSYRLDEHIPTVIKGGYFLATPEFLDYLTDDCFFENGPFQTLISNRRAAVFDHTGFWKQVDSWRDLEELQKLFQEDDRSWVIT